MATEKKVRLRKSVLLAAPPNLFGGDDEARLVRRETTELDLSFNYIPELSIPRGLWALRILNLGGNRLTQVPSGICHLHNLAELYLNNNAIAELDFGSGGGRGGDTGTDGPATNLPCLRVFDLRQNACGGLLRLPRGCGSSLERLTISSNRFEGVDWDTEGAFPSEDEGFPSLRLLSLHGNGNLSLKDCVRIVGMCCGDEKKTSALSVLFVTGSELCSRLSLSGRCEQRGNVWDKEGTTRCLARLYAAFRNEDGHEPFPRLQWINGTCIFGEERARASLLAAKELGSRRAGGATGAAAAEAAAAAATTTAAQPPSKKRRVR